MESTGLGWPVAPEGESVNFLLEGPYRPRRLCLDCQTNENKIFESKFDRLFESSIRFQSSGIDVLSNSIRQSICPPWIYILLAIHDYPLMKNYEN